MDLIIPIDSDQTTPLYEQIYAYIRQEIRGRSIRAGEKLPSTRILADHLKVSRSTTQLAYDQLLAEGYIRSEPCRGYFVQEIEELRDPEAFRQTGKTIREKDGGSLSAAFSEKTSGETLPTDRERAGIRPFAEDEPFTEPSSFADDRIDFSPRGIDLDHFPYSVWSKLTREILRGEEQEERKELFRTGSPQGEPELRRAILRYLHTSRGVSCGEEQIIIGAGSEYLLMLLTRILGEARSIAMENPTYSQATRVFRSMGYPIRPVAMDRSGLSLQELQKSGAQLAYVMPSHQYPTGIVMPAARRQELLRWAGETEERYLIEDDYDSEFRYKGKPIPALQGMDRQEKVIYIGTFSKSIAPAIRVGYLVLPPRLLAVYREKCWFYTSTVSRIDQKILTRFLEEGHYERHLNRMRAIYRGKHDCLLEALQALSADFIISGEHAGIHILLTAKRGQSEEELITQAARAGVTVYPFSSYDISGSRQEAASTVILGYANVSPEQIREGVRRLGLAWGETGKPEV